MLPDRRVEDELRRLRVPPLEKAQPGGVGTVRFVVACHGNAHSVLRRIKQVLTTVAEETQDAWPAVETWRPVLPSWFVERCVASMSASEDEAWIRIWESLSEAERQQEMAEQEDRSLEDWLCWMQPENRYWFRWDGCDIDSNTVLVALKVQEWPFPRGAFRWLAAAAGAEKVEPESGD